MSRKAKWYTAIVVVFTPFLFAFAVLLTGHMTHTAAAPPFPSVVKGVSVKWIPDKEVRAAAADLTPDDVEYIELHGGDTTGVSSQVIVTRRETIALFLEGMRRAVRRNDYPFEAETCGENGCVGIGVPIDELLIAVKPSKGSPRSIIFLADLIEGEQPLMPCGTVSPRFQDALRAAGVPNNHAHNVPEGLFREIAVRLHNW